MYEHQQKATYYKPDMLTLYNIPLGHRNTSHTMIDLHSNGVTHVFTQELMLLLLERAH